MAQRTLPLLYLNLGGEMMYVLDQRLHAQRVDGIKRAKVLDDIASTMFNERFLEEIFLKHGSLRSKRMLRAMFDKLAHASIMRLNEKSMEKLYDLMVMAYKHQLVLSPNPQDIIMITLNHLDAIRDYAQSERVKKNMELAYDLLIQSYCTLSVCELQQIRHAILNFLQDYKVRVSIFLQEGKQEMDGRFVFGPYNHTFQGVEPPGLIRQFDEKGEVLQQSTFDPGVTFLPAEPPGGVGRDEIGHRGTAQGLNMYVNSSLPMESVTQVSGGASVKPVENEVEMDPARRMSAAAAVYRAPGEDAEDASRLAKEELNLLAKMIGGQQGGKQQSKDTFRLNIFDKGDESAPLLPKSNDTSCSVNIDLKSQPKKGNKALDKIIGEMSNVEVNSNDNDDDLLSLMDKAQ